LLYFRPVYDVLVKRLGASFMQYCLRPEIGKVEIAPFAYMRGRTFENAVVILDEAQNVTAAQMKMFLTRLGENVTVIVNGDITQCDLPSGVKSGLSDAMSRFEEDEMIGVVRFTKEDCVRSALCQRTPIPTKGKALSFYLFSNVPGVMPGSIVYTPQKFSLI
jgi:phosphate starvation-inducible PhoH-like protein